MVKSETTIRRELKAVREELKDGGITDLELDELKAVKATLQWVLGQPNLEWSDACIPPRKKESRRLVAWVEDRSGGAVE